MFSEPVEVRWHVGASSIKSQLCLVLKDFWCPFSTKRKKKQLFKCCYNNKYYSLPISNAGCYNRIIKYSYLYFFKKKILQKMFGSTDGKRLWPKDEEVLGSMGHKDVCRVLCICSCVLWVFGAPTQEKITLEVNECEVFIYLILLVVHMFLHDK